MDQWAEKFQELKSEYISGAGERFRQIACFLDQLDQEPSDNKALKNLRRYFYGLSGTGATYGFPQVTVLGFQGENECEALLKKNLSPKSCDLERWRNYLLAIKEEFFKVGSYSKS